MELDTTQQTGLARFISPNVKIPDPTSALDPLGALSDPRSRWRRKIFQLIDNTIQLADREGDSRAGRIWKNEAVQRASNFAELSVMDFRFRDGTAKLSNKTAWDVKPIEALAASYRSLADHRATAPVNCEHLLYTISTSLAAIYRPFLGKPSFKFNLQPVSLVPIRNRALLLSLGLLIQGFLRHAAQHAADANLQLILRQEQKRHCRLTLCANPILTAILLSPEYEIALRLLGIAEAEFTCRSGDSGGTNIQLRFPSHSVP